MLTKIGKGFADDHALILYVYLTNYDDGEDGSVLTVSFSSPLESILNHADGCSSITFHPLVHDFEILHRKLALAMAF